jgi:hypothetical protein
MKAARLSRPISARQVGWGKKLFGCEPKKKVPPILP